MGKIIKIWVVGFLIATLNMWLIGFFFVSPVPDWRECKELGIYVRKPGTVHRFSEEGFSKSVYGKYGIIGIPDAAAVVEPKVLIWGDSFVEGYQLPDDEKLAQQVSSIWAQRYQRKVIGVGIGCSGRAVADYYNLMPAYEKLLNPICHVILIADFSDLEPDGVCFLEKPEYKIASYKDNKKLIRLRRFLNSISLNFFYPKLTKIVEKGLNLRFRLGVAKITNSSEATPAPDASVSVEAWDFMVGMLRQRTTLPILIVYTPAAPEICSGKLVLEDKYSTANQSQILASICHKHNINYIDMKDRNINFFNETGKFPRGFHNGGFTTGHCNKYGHRLTAEAICGYVEENINGIHSN
jgi:hypothetical protein